MKKFIGVCLSALALVSCVRDDYDFSAEKLENFAPTVGAPIVNTEFTLHDLVGDYLDSDTGLLSIDADSLLWITYSSRLFQMGVSDLFSIDDQTVNESFSLEPFSIDDISNSTAITLGDVVSGFSDPEKTQIQSADGFTAPFPPLPAQSGGTHSAGSFSEFTEVTFSEGMLDIKITNNWPIDLTNLIIEIRNNGDNSLIGTLTYPNIASGSNSTESIDLTGKTMSNQINTVITNIESPGSLTPVPIDLSDELQVDVNTSGLKVSGGSATFPSQAVLDETFNVDLSTGNGEQLTTLILADGQIELDLNYGIREDATITISMPYASKNGIPLSETFNINSDNTNPTTLSETIDLSGYTFDLTAGGSGFNIIELNIQASIVSSGFPVPFSVSDAVEADVTFGGVVIDYVEGDVGTQTFNLEQDTVDFSFSEFDFGAQITLADPRINLTLTNAFGIEIGADLSSIEARNETQSVALTGLATPLIIGAPTIAQVGDSVRTTIEINSTTTNIDDVLSISPTELIFGMSGSTNPNGATTNFVSGDSYLGVEMDVQIPLYGGVSGFELRDTLDFPTDIFNNVVEGYIRANITNEFPVDVTVQAYFVNDNYEILDSLDVTPIEVLQSSSVNATTGELEEASENVTDIELSEGKADRIKEATKIILVSTMATANNGATNAKFYSSYSIGIKLAVFATVRVSLDGGEQ